MDAQQPRQWHDQTPRGRDLLKKLTATQLVKKSSAFYGILKFITVFTRACHWSASWGTWIQTTPSRPVSVRFNLPFSSHLRLGRPTCLFPSGFPTIRYHIYLSWVKMKLKLSLCLTKRHAMKLYWEWRYSSTHSLTSALYGGEWAARERAPGTHWIGCYLPSVTLQKLLIYFQAPHAAAIR